jgi:hypothetical protein
MLALLQDYVNHLRMTEYPHTGSRSSNIENYYMPSETVEADEWAEFENVYQLHAPKVFMNDSIRDVLRSWYAPLILLLITIYRSCYSTITVQRRARDLSITWQRGS